MSNNKTQATDHDVITYLEAVRHPVRRADALALHALFSETTGYPARMWGPSMIGYGRYHYRYDSGREGDFLATGFAPRATSLVIYIMPGYADFKPLLDRLGKWRKGKSCLYINTLADVDTTVLRELILAGLKDLQKIWSVRAT